MPITAVLSEMLRSSPPESHAILVALGRRGRLALRYMGILGIGLALLLSGVTLLWVMYSLILLMIIAAFELVVQDRGFTQIAWQHDAWLALVICAVIIAVVVVLVSLMYGSPYLVRLGKWFSVNINGRASKGAVRATWQSLRRDLIAEGADVLALEQSRRLGERAQIKKDCLSRNSRKTL